MVSREELRSLFKLACILLIAPALACSQDTASRNADTAGAADQPTEAELMRGFKGTIELDTRDSKPDWTPFIPKEAPEGAPNILFILYDDTGQAAWSPYGGRI